MPKSKTKSKKSKKSKKEHIMTIPELRSSFEHIENWTDSHVKKMSTEELVPLFQEEWEHVFYKPVDKASATAYIEHRHKDSKGQSGGYQSPLIGAPLDYTVRPGLYVVPGVNQHSYAQTPAYVDKGFWNPAIAQSYDPVPGQTIYPTRTPVGMGSNSVQSGGRSKTAKALRHRTRKARRQQGGSSFLQNTMTAMTQLMFRPVSYLNPPPSVLNDAQSAIRGQPLGQSPDPVQTHHAYRMSPTQSSVVGALPISAIPISLKRDIMTN